MTSVATGPGEWHHRPEVPSAGCRREKHPHDGIISRKRSSASAIEALPVIIVILTGAAFWETAHGRTPEPFAPVLSAGAVSYAAALLWLRRRT